MKAELIGNFTDMENGAWCSIRWKDEPFTNLHKVYISFSHDDVDDEKVFFYCNGEHGLKKLMRYDNGEEFVVMAVLE